MTTFPSPDEPTAHLLGHGYDPGTTVEYLLENPTAFHLEKSIAEIERGSQQ